MSAVTVENLFMEYDGNPVLERVNLAVAHGTFTAIVGASGCGKSTFLRLLLSQERPTRGAIRIDGEPVAAEPTPDRGIVFQRYSVFPHLTVTENLMLPAELAGSRLFGRLFLGSRRRAREGVTNTLQRIGLWAARDRYPAQLSGGMQQRLAIAQALLMKPKVLLLDEPFGALDPGIRADMHAILLELWREENMTVFMVTHDIGEAFKLATRVLVFDKVRHDPDFPEAYGSTITYDLALTRKDAAPPPRLLNPPLEGGSKAQSAFGEGAAVADGPPPSRTLLAQSPTSPRGGGSMEPRSSRQGAH
ncbi:MAG: ATP-binding cassette domain-containing protein [Bauldia sp.]|nr:ATP-binding cassette domain-containing protein [Bauldia sp.]